MSGYLLFAGAIAALGPLGFIIGVVQAQTQENAQIARGAIIAAQGTPTGAPPCSQCHAFNGVSDGSGAFPRLAGQSAYYLAKQLRDYASGVRTSALMTPIAKALSLTPDSIADTAVYYASQNAPFLPLQPGAPALITRGQQLAMISSETEQIRRMNDIGQQMKAACSDRSGHRLWTDSGPRLTGPRISRAGLRMSRARRCSRRHRRSGGRRFCRLPPQPAGRALRRSH
jgi:cytochrome c553